MSKDAWEGEEFKGWTVHEYLGGGDNGVVHRATRADQQGAIKILKPHLWTGKRYERFTHEIEGMRRFAKSVEEQTQAMTKLIALLEPKQSLDTVASDTEIRLKDSLVKVHERVPGAIMTQRIGVLAAATGKDDDDGNDDDESHDGRA